MSEKWSFRFSVPRPPEGTPVSSEEAERFLRARIAEAPQGSKTHGEAIWQLSRFLAVTGRQSEALREVEGLLAFTVDPEERAGIVLGMGQLMEQLGDYASAIEAYTRGVSLEPVAPRTWYLLHNNLGYCLNHFGRHAEAEHWCRAAIGIDPERHNAHKNLGLACQGQGRFAEAARCFIAAVQAEAADPRALRHLEELVAAHPEVAAEVPDLDRQVELCRTAVGAARAQQSGLRPSGPPELRGA